MQSISLVMPLISSCSVSDCAYNKDKMCNARAITVGDQQHPRCDTFFKGDTHVSHTRKEAGVGACKVSSCKHNEDFECMADKISVAMSNNEVRCKTCEVHH